MIHPHTALKFINDAVGFGVVATEPLPLGTIVWVQDDLDRVFEPHEIETLPELFHKRLDHFTFRDNLGRYVLCWDHGRYVNHSSRSNCMTTGYGFEIVVRDIAAGEELTDDYGYLNLEQPFEVFPEKGTKRTTILPDDLVRFHPEWDRQLEKAFRYLTHVEQPLAQLLDSDMWETVVAVAEGREDMLSILNCYYAGGNGQLANRLARD